MATKPSSITTGDGTQGSPYEVHSYDEIKWCCEDSEARPAAWSAGTPVYFKLVNDIDCQEYDVDFTWTITTIHAIDFNLATHTIKTFYLAENGCLFNTNTANSDIKVHDGKILNVYAQWETGSRALLRSNGSNSFLKFTNISFSVDADKFTNAIVEVSSNSTTNHKIVNCSFYLQNIHPIGTSTGRTCMTYGAITYSCCDFEMHQKPDTYFQGGSSATTSHCFDSGGSIYTNCRFQGDVVCKSYSTTLLYNKLFSGTLRNCVYAVDTTISGLASVTSGAYVICALNNTSVYGIYNSDLIHIDTTVTNFQFDAGGRYIECHTSDMDMRVNPNADQRLNELGFDVIKG